MKNNNKLFTIIFYLVFNAAICISTSVKSYAAPIVQNPTSISVSELPYFYKLPTQVQKLIDSALDLASKNLGYLYGSANPKNGGMDCSGTIYYLLTSFGLPEVPRSSDLQYQWVLKEGHFHPVQNYNFTSKDFSNLNPGDLLFWSGTYEVKRAINVSHVMMYLGRNNEGKPLMIGASDGRTYQGKKIYGVSVFDFQLPNGQGKSRFLGYSCIPRVSC